MNKTLVIAVAVSLLFAGSAWAEHEGHEAHSNASAIEKPVIAKVPAPIEVKPLQAVIEVDGLVCATCGYGIERNMARLNFIDRKKFSHGVLTDIYNQKLVLALVPKQPVDIKALSEAIHSAGYPLKVVHLRIAGTLEQKNGKTLLKDNETGQWFELQGDLPAAQTEVVLQVHIGQEQIKSYSPSNPVPVVVNRRLNR